MSLAAALANAKPKRRGPPCRMGVLLAALPVGERDALAAELADDRLESTVIADALQAEGFDIGDAVVRYHRNGKCQCGKRPS